MNLIDADQWDRQKRVSGWRQEAVQTAKCLVVGAGALGNEVCKLLLQLGVRELSVVDFDEVVAANLNRCVFFTHADALNKEKKAFVVARQATKINPDASVRALVKRVEQLPESFFGEFDFVFTCLDSVGARLHANAHCYGKSILIDGGTAGFNGKAQVVRSPGPCLECGLSKRDYDFLWRRYSCTGEMLEFVDPKMPALPTTTSVIAAVQANEFVKLAHASGGASSDNEASVNPITQVPVVRKKEERTFAFPANDLVGKYFFYNGLRNESAVFSVAKRASCPVHV